MASANWGLASQLQARLPHTYTSMEHLVMAMADAFNNRGKTTFFGSDKGLKSLMKFEEKLKGTLLAMTMDGVVARTSTANDFRDSLETLIAAWFEIFPNWPDAQAFAYEKISANKKQAAELIAALIGVRLS